jgi:putative PIN family toxin of toxin-antitoxin system
MRIMIDTNVILSAIYNPESKPAYVLRHVCENHKFVLCDYIVAECYDVINRKFPHHKKVLVKLLTSLEYELVSAPKNGLAMPDPKDSPILNSAIMADVDIIISGDKHFLSLDMKRPRVFSPAQYIEIWKDSEIT